MEKGWANAVNWKRFMNQLNWLLHGNPLAAAYGNAFAQPTNAMGWSSLSKKLIVFYTLSNIFVIALVLFAAREIYLAIYEGGWFLSLPAAVVLFLGSLGLFAELLVAYKTDLRDKAG